MAAMKSSECHNFSKLAEESGFAFGPLRPRVFVDWNRIRSIDIEALIRERKFYLIEQHIGDILNCTLESEFDVRILDQGVIKMFKLAQLAVEYQQFCRQYLDRSINVLRDEITALVQELENCRKELRERDEEIKRLRKKTKHTYCPPIPYGNDNIATLILKTLTNKNDVFPSTSNSNSRAYNRCNYCDKAFLNQLYLKSHITRRHAGMTDINFPEKENTTTAENADSNTEIVNVKLSEEIMQLKSKLSEMEVMISNKIIDGHNAEEIKSNDIIHSGYNSEYNKEGVRPTTEKSDNDIDEKNTKDAEASKTTEEYILDKIEEWKKEESEKYNTELKVLRTQILETINYMKEKEPQSKLAMESESIDHLRVIIKQQGEELNALKQELESSKQIQGNENLERRKEAEAQIMFLAQRTEIQAKQYEALLLKLNEVAREAKDSRALAEAEREHATQLQELLHNHLNNKQLDKESRKNGEHEKKPDMNSLRNRSKQNYLKTDRRSLESLHRKAQELLNIDTSSSSDISSEHSVKDIKVQQTPKKEIKTIQTKHNKVKSFDATKVSKYPKITNSRKIIMEQVADNEQICNGNIEKHVENFRNGSHGKPGSPVKVVRAKITEEVNNRLSSFGVDPLNNILPQHVFKRHRIKLQLQQDTKAKKNPAYSKVRHKILTYIDLNTSALKEGCSEVQEYVSPSKASRAFSISSVLSNVKSKALALVQTNETKGQQKSDAFKGHKNFENTRTSTNTAKSQTDSESSSPQVQRRKVSAEVNNAVNVRQRHPSEPSLLAGINKFSQIRNASNNDDENSSESDDYKYSAVTELTKKSVESLVTPPARRPSSANAIYDNKVRKFTMDDKDSPTKDVKQGNEKGSTDPVFMNMSEDEDSSMEAMLKKAASVDNVQVIPKQTKGVLKNASSASSLNKKKVLFDMEAIQMKSVSASPSQSINEKSDYNEKFELGLINLQGEDWDISSIENEPLNNDTKIKLDSRTSPKIAELRQSIESQLARRKEGNTNLVGAVDVMKGPLIKVPSVTGSNTSLGSSILDESDAPPIVKTNDYVNSKRTSENNDSDLDISDYSTEAMVSNKSKKKEESF